MKPSDAPLVAGHTWVARGTAGHARGHTAFIVRISSRSVVIRYGGSAHRNDRPYNVLFAVFRQQFDPRP